MRLGGDALGYRPDPVQPQAVDRHGAEHGDNLNGRWLPGSGGVFPQLNVVHPVPGIFNAPAVPHQA